MVVLANIIWLTGRTAADKYMLMCDYARLLTAPLRPVLCMSCPC
jgi:hypothetical protein